MYKYNCSELFEDCNFTLESKNKNKAKTEVLEHIKNVHKKEYEKMLAENPNTNKQIEVFITPSADKAITITPKILDFLSYYIGAITLTAWLLVNVRIKVFDLIGIFSCLVINTLLISNYLKYKRYGCILNIFVLMELVYVVAFIYFLITPR